MLKYIGDLGDWEAIWPEAERRIRSRLRPKRVYVVEFHIDGVEHSYVVSRDHDYLLSTFEEGFTAYVDLDGKEPISAEIWVSGRGNTRWEYIDENFLNHVEDGWYATLHGVDKGEILKSAWWKAVAAITVEDLTTDDLARRENVYTTLYELK